MSGTPGTVSFSRVCASELTRPAAISGATNASTSTVKVRSAIALSMKARSAPSYASFGLVHAVCDLASCVAFAMYSVIRAVSMGHAPTRVW